MRKPFYQLSIHVSVGIQCYETMPPQQYFNLSVIGIDSYLSLPKSMS